MTVGKAAALCRAVVNAKFNIKLGLTQIWSFVGGKAKESRRGC